jgi:predicted methyltransferase
MTAKNKQSTLAISLIVFLAACGSDTGADIETSSDALPDHSPVYVQALQNADRSDSDRARDASRKPAEVLEFLGIAPGMAVLDLFSGGGYYSEFASYVVGDEGTVVAHSNEAYLGFVGEEFESRYAGGRLGNVTVLMAENNELDLEPASFDAVLMMLTFHDLYYAAPKQGWPKIHSAQLLAQIHQSLKPGGIVGIIDHYAEAGAPRETGNTLHRIDPRIVIAEMEAAGFRLDAKSSLLRNMHDDYSKVVFDPQVRGKTDRFVLRFVKSE